MDIRTYRNFLTSHGSNLAEIKRHQSETIINNTFTRDSTYKQVYILTRNGWKFEEAKYQYHTTPSILKDAVDYYLQFRPHVHYPIGSYVIVPDDNSSQVNLSASELLSPFDQPIDQRTQWWMIVGRDSSNEFVRYNILQCNWNFQWVYDGQVQNCYGALRNANSYTSGKWTDEISSSLDNLIGAWLPDLYHVYGDKLQLLGMDDNRTIFYEQRFMITNNSLEPRVYQVTKNVDVFPPGIMKLSLKQDEYDKTRDNAELCICDYYSKIGESKLDFKESTALLSSHISQMQINAQNELEVITTDTNSQLYIGNHAYFQADFPDTSSMANWKISLVSSNDYEKPNSYYENLLKMEFVDSHTLLLKIGKAKSLIGKTFVLSVTDEKGEYYSSIEIEVRS